MVITETAFLVLESIHQSSWMALRGWQCLFFLEKISRDIDERHTLNLEWKGNDDSVIQWQLKCQEPENVIAALVRRMEKIGVPSETRRFERTRIREEDVSPQALKNAHIDEVIQMIGIQEEMVSNDITIQNITGLLNLYQKAIEHYSALSSNKFEEFLHRQKTLLGREDIQIVLNSIEEEEQRQAQNTPHNVSEVKDVFMGDSDEEDKLDNMLLDETQMQGFRIDSESPKSKASDESKIEFESPVSANSQNEEAKALEEKDENIKPKMVEREKSEEKPEITKEDIEALNDEVEKEILEPQVEIVDG